MKDIKIREGSKYAKKKIRRNVDFDDSTISAKINLSTSAATFIVELLKKILEDFDEFVAIFQNISEVIIRRIRSDDY